MDSAEHKKFTGADNDIILKNAIKASSIVREMIIRLPLIPGFNDGDDNIIRTGLFMKENLTNIKRIDILPYHSIGASKCERIGREYLFAADAAVPDEKLNAVIERFMSLGFETVIGG
jgi:pyruvate formate lyase activating enzyme